VNVLSTIGDGLWNAFQSPSPIVERTFTRSS